MAARKLVKNVYLTTTEFPKNESFGIVSQIRRACISIAANIAEGAGRGTNKDFSRFLEIANGSSYESECLLILAGDLKYLSNEKQLSLTSSVREIQKMISGLKKSLKD